ncbi:ATP-binding protein [Umezawaea endophytica]|uniref:ATP-binding protein n=1 Tax=Umezawaea endophytica TaxID=1654476 RepID=A0A9X2VJ49_9PSEU|nr:ATP-binding protein [Umezawaea endophytica]MCS7477680.1 ATP-binding protein [Umezawaea endophytica]
MVEWHSTTRHADVADEEHFDMADPEATTMRPTTWPAITVDPAPVVGSSRPVVLPASELLLSQTSQVYLPVKGTQRTTLLTMSIARDDLATVRERVRLSLDWCSPDVVGDVELVATELISNAVDHARLPHQVTIASYVPRDVDPAVLIGRGEVLIEVLDGSRDLVPLINQSTAGPYRGRGMRLVQTLSRSWGVLRGERTKTVWAAMTLA